MTYKHLALIFILFFLAGCANKGIDLSSGDLGSLVMFNEESFLEKEVDINLTADFEATGMEVVLNNPANKILLTYNLPFEADKVYITELPATGYEDWRLYRVMVEGEDYFYAKDKKKLYMVVGAPSFYLLNSSFGYKFKLTFVTANQRILRHNKNIVMHWKPLNEKATSEASKNQKQLIYFDSLAKASKEINANASKHLTYQKIISRLAQEASHSSSLRITKDLCQEINTSLLNLDLGRLTCRTN